MKLMLIMFFSAVMMVGCASKKQPATAKATNSVSQSAAPAAENSSDADKISCTKGSDTRTLEIVKKGAGCALEYDKSGKKSDVSTSTHGTAHCKASQKKIRTKLEHSGYKCE